MRPQLVVAGVLAGTFVLGGVLGAVATGSLAEARSRKLEAIRDGGGFVSHMEDVIQPRDEAQRAVLLPFLEATDERNRRALEDTRVELQAALRAMRDSVAPLLDEAQLARLDALIRRPRPRRPPGLGPPPRRPPPPGGRPGGPPPRRPPPRGAPPGG